ncbi:MAG: hypothetical protein R2856_07820 [Caldilineaceae bacterium]
MPICMAKWCAFHWKRVDLLPGAAGLAGNNLLLASADHGFAHAEDLHAESTDMLFNIHDGAFSMPVNFHAVGEYLCHTRGDVLYAHRVCIQQHLRYGVHHGTGNSVRLCAI